MKCRALFVRAVDLGCGDGRAHRPARRSSEAECAPPSDGPTRPAMLLISRQLLEEMREENCGTHGGSRVFFCLPGRRRSSSESAGPSCPRRIGCTCRTAQAAHPYCVRHEGSGNTRPMQCLDSEGSENTRQGWCLGHKGSGNTRGKGGLFYIKAAKTHKEKTVSWPRRQCLGNEGSVLATKTVPWPRR